MLLDFTCETEVKTEQSSGTWRNSFQAAACLRKTVSQICDHYFLIMNKIKASQARSFTQLLVVYWNKTAEVMFVRRQNSICLVFVRLFSVELINPYLDLADVKQTHHTNHVKLQKTMVFKIITKQTKCYSKYIPPDKISFASITVLKHDDLPGNASVTLFSCSLIPMAVYKTQTV